MVPRNNLSRVFHFSKTYRYSLSRQNDKNDRRNHFNLLKYDFLIFLHVIVFKRIQRYSYIFTLSSLFKVLCGFMGTEYTGF